MVILAISPSSDVKTPLCFLSLLILFFLFHLLARIQKKRVFLSPAVSHWILERCRVVVAVKLLVCVAAPTSYLWHGTAAAHQPFIGMGVDGRFWYT
jgi:hypothetical protein